MQNWISWTTGDTNIWCHDFFVASRVSGCKSLEGSKASLPGPGPAISKGYDPKIGVFFPQNGWWKSWKPLFFNGWFGGKTHYFRKHPYLPKGVWIPSRIPQTPLLQRFPKLVCSIWCIMQAKVWGLAWQGFCKFYIFVLHLLKHFLRENAEPLLSWPDEAVCRTLNSSRGWKKDGKLAEGTYMLQGMGDTPTLPLAMIVALHIVHGDAGKHN